MRLPLPHFRLIQLGQLGLLVGLVVLAYARSGDAPFVFDDTPAVVGNTTIRHLWPPWDALQPPADATGATGRPLVNLSLALNYALGGLAPRGYHFTNVALHLLTALMLWKVLRRALHLVPRLSEAETADAVAFGATLLWATHPLLSESVICIVQRNEILVALCYLLTFYCFLRSLQPTEKAGVWQTMAVASCFLGMASKEVMAAAPLLVFLADRTFFAGSFSAAWRARRGFYLGLAASWLLLAGLVWSSRQRAGTVGFGLGITAWDYLLTQCFAITHYLRLAAWPHPLVVDYGMSVVQGLSEVWWRGLGLIALLVASVWGVLARRTWWGFLGVAFFALLAPSSSIVPLTTQTVAEHRMYLPLALVVILAAAGLGRLGARVIVAASIAVGTGWAVITAMRAGDYRDARTLWAETATRAPHNPRAHLNYGDALLRAGDLRAAEAEYTIAIGLNPKYPEALYALGLVESRTDRPLAAIDHYRAALVHAPGYTAVRGDLAAALARTGQPREALAELERAGREQAPTAALQLNLGNVHLELGEAAAARTAFQAALQLEPGWVPALLGLGRVAQLEGHAEAAIAVYREALQQERDNPEAQAALATALLAARQPAEAAQWFSKAIERLPDRAELHANFASALMQLGRRPEAIAHLQTATRLAPSVPELQLNLALALAASGRLAEALAHCEEALRLRPEFPAARHYLEQIRADLEKSRREN